MKTSRQASYRGLALVVTVVAAIVALVAVFVWPSSDKHSEETARPPTTQAPSTSIGPVAPIGPTVASPPYTSDARAAKVAQLTGGTTAACVNWKVCGTDLGIPYTLENGSTGYLFGDTFSTDAPTGVDWRSPVMLRSTTNPGLTTPIVFDSAAGVLGNGMAVEILPNGHRTSGEFTVIPTDGISFPETGEQIISYMSVNNWDQTVKQGWATNYAGLAYSKDGNHFERMDPIWKNDSTNDDPYQMWSMQRDGNYVYIVSVKAGRQVGPMMLRRVEWDKILNPNAYQCWDGTTWGPATTCKPLMSGHFGEPSLRRLSDGTWVMAYLELDSGAIVTRYASSVTGPWSDEKIQVTSAQVPSLYGGYIHPASTPKNLTLIVSQWSPQSYTALQFNGTL